jgi:signal transduction histidine kinase
MNGTDRERDGHLHRLHHVAWCLVHFRQEGPWGYGTALALAIAGLVLGAYLRSITGMVGVPYSILATVLAAIVGGFGPGILAALVSAIGTDILILQPLGLGDLTKHGVVRILIYAFIASVLSLLVSALRDSIFQAEKAQEVAEKANAEKDAVIEFLSHDLRGPLASISLSFQLVQKYLEAGGKEREIKRLSANGVFFCHRMAQLIQNLLDASKIKSGGITLVPERHDLTEILLAVVEEYRLLAEEKKVSLQFESNPSLSHFVRCDRVLLSQVIANLLQNAFKFTPPGGLVSLTLEERIGKIELRVRDTGPGIPSSAHSNIFEKFWQAKRVTGEGVGLGLFLGRAIVEAHRGEISVQSELGKGTTFTIMLPREEQASLRECSGQVSLCGASQHSA